jgi:hypothetical protein
MAAPGGWPVIPVLRAEAAALAAAASAAALTEIAPPSRPLAMVRAEPVVQSGHPLRPHVRIDYTGAARWDALPHAEDWSEATLAALRAAPHDLADVVPRDIATWCPGYAANPPHLREAFWVGMISALARHESTFNPRASGGGGQWIGLLQIYPPTADHFGCSADSVSELQDPAANLSCGARIMSVTVRRDNAVAVLDGRWRGVAADWGPMTESRKREDMIAWTRTQDYCQPRIDHGAVATAVLPPLRPADLTGDTVLASAIGPLVPLSLSSRGMQEPEPAAIAHLTPPTRVSATETLSGAIELALMPPTRPWSEDKQLALLSDARQLYLD